MKECVEMLDDVEDDEIVHILGLSSGKTMDEACKSITEYMKNTLKENKRAELIAERQKYGGTLC